MLWCNQGPHSLIICCILMIFAQGIEASVIEVGDEIGWHSNISEGILAAADGDTVLIHPGTYTGPMNVDIEVGDLSLVVTGVHKDSVLIDCQGTGRAFLALFDSPQTLTIEDMSVVGGSVSSYPQNLGGGVYVRNGNLIASRVNISSCAAASGGGLAVYDGSLLLRGSEFTSCTATVSGGAVYSAGSSQVVINDVQLRVGQAAQGGGAFIHGGVVDISDATLEGNVAYDRGGGLYVSGCDSVLIGGSRILGNTSQGSIGGGLAAIQSESVHVVDVEVSGNHSGLHGGGLAFSNADHVKIEDALITTNSSEAGSSGILISDAVWFDVLYCTIASNFCTDAAPNSQGTLMVVSAFGGEVQRSIVAHNDGDYGIGIHGCGPRSSVSCSNVYGNSEGLYLGDLGDQTGINGNVSSEPLFCDLVEYCISEESPCAPNHNDCGVWMGSENCQCPYPVGVGDSEAIPASSFRELGMSITRHSINTDFSGHEGHSTWKLSVVDVLGRVCASDAGVVRASKLSLAIDELHCELPSGAYFSKMECSCGGRGAIKVIWLK